MLPLLACFRASDLGLGALLPLFCIILVFCSSFVLLVVVLLSVLLIMGYLTFRCFVLPALYPGFDRYWSRCPEDGTY